MPRLGRARLAAGRTMRVAPGRAPMTAPLPTDIVTLIQQCADGAALLLGGAGGEVLVVTCNATYAALHGYHADELRGQPVRLLGAAPDVLELRRTPTEEARRARDGAPLTLEVARATLTLQGESYLFETVRDVSARKALVTQLHERALQDGLTGLGNRRAFDQDLDQELSRSARHAYPVTVVMADLDALKQVNDEFGHERGDELLRSFAQRLRRHFRKSDRLYRLGGDEFAVILPHADTRAFGEVLRKVGAAMEEVRARTGLRFADVSAGYATYPDEAVSQGDLVRLADERMYGQKRAHHGARSGDARAAGQASATVQAVLQRAIRSTFALLTAEGELGRLDWAALLEAAVIAVPGAERGALLVLERDRYVLQAVSGLPEALLGAWQSVARALHWYAGPPDAWRLGRPRTLDAPARLLAHLEPARDQRERWPAASAQPDGAWLCVPLVAEGQVVAHLNFGGGAGRTFAAASTRAALEFGEQMAALLASRTRRRREANRQRELEALAALNVALGHARTPEVVERVLAEQAVEMLVTRYATYLRHDPVSDCLVSSVSSGQLAESRPVVLARGVGLSWQAFERRAVVHFGDARREVGGYQHEPLAVSLSTLYAPVVSSEGVVLGVLAVGREASPFSDLDVRLAQAMTSAAATSLERTGEALVVRRAREGTLHALGLALEARDFETRGHTERVVALSQRFAQRLGLPPELIEAIREGAYLHDIGKLSVPDQVLLKAGALTPRERAIVQTHAEIGFELSRRIPVTQEAALLIRHHHERWDGAGYPLGLAGEGIPLLARMFALVDVYDALISTRTYKRAWSAARAVEEIARGAGTQFDPALTRVFLDLLAQAADDQPAR